MGVRDVVIVHTPITSITIIFTYAFCACSRSPLLSLTGSGMSWRDNYCGVGLPSQAYVFPSNSFWLWGDGPSFFASTAFLDQAPADTGDSVWIIRTWSPSVFLDATEKSCGLQLPLCSIHTGSVSIPEVIIVDQRNMVKLGASREFNISPVYNI